MASQDQSGGLQRFMLVLAIAGTVGWLSYEVYDHFRARGPGDNSYLAGNTLFKDGYYGRAVTAYEAALKEAPDHEPAMSGLANSLIQLKRYDEALAVLNRAIVLKPDFGGYHATRGIALDRMGRHEEAIAAYETALKLNPDIAEGMHWLDRLLYNVQDKPPTIADRLAYLKQQMALPESQRVLKVDEIDKTQRPYEQ